MRAAFIHGIKDVRVADKADPAIERGDVGIRVSGVGVCGSDLHYYLEGGIGAAKIQAPFVPGHEFAGRVIKDRPELGLARGQLVAVDPAQPCGECQWCRRGHINLCPHVVFLGAPPHDGAMSETIAVRPDQIHALPDDFDLAQAVMLEPLGVAVHALDIIKPRLLETVAVLGCGPIGLCLVQVARAAGASWVYAIDPVGYRAAIAERLGAHEVASRVAAVGEATAGRGVDVVLEATNAPEGMAHAVDAARIGGRILLAGIPEGNQYTLDAAAARRKGLSIKLSRRMGHVFPRAIHLIAQGMVNVDDIVTHRFDLEQTSTAFALQSACEDGAIKSLVLPNGADNAST